MSEQERSSTAQGEAEETSASPGAPAPPAGEPEAPVGPSAEPPADPSAEPPGQADPAEPEPEPEPEPAHAVLERDLDELVAKAEKADEYLEMARRARADFENFRKRAARDAAAAQERGLSKLARELLPAIDNLERALAAAEAGPADGDGGLTNGIRLVHTDVISALQRVGIEPYSPHGEPFDPAHHEAVAQQPVEGAEPGTVAEVYQRGYRLGESVLRPARVLVAG